MARLGFGYGAAKRNRARSNAAVVTSTVAHQGVTFSLASARPAGQYANGDWWVLGPVTINSITPASAIVNGTRANGSTFTGRAIHGAMLNPGNRSFVAGGLLANNNGINPFIQQGFDSYTGTIPYVIYSAPFNVDPVRTGSPLTVSSGTVVKCLSDTNSATLDPNGRQAPLRFVTLTVVSGIPMVEAIRPGMSRASTASPIRASDFDLSVFQNLPPVAGAPTYSEALSFVSGTFNTFQPSSIESANMMPKTHPEYGREVANRIHAGLLALHLSIYTAEQKRTLLMHLASFVDDIVSRAEEGGIGYANGGGNQWKKPALVVLTAALGLKAPPSWVQYCNAALQPHAWAEDTHFSRVTGYDFLVPRLTGDSRPRTPFSFLAVGDYDWGNWGAGIRSDPGMNWDLAYRVNYNGAFFAGLLAVTLTAGAVALWNNPAVFRFMRTFWHRRDDNTDVTNGPQPFVRAMATAYLPADLAVPQRVAAQVRGNGWSVRFDKPLDERGTAPAAGDFTVVVNGSPVAVSTVQVWRQTVGGTLASPIASGTDVVTISYTPGANPIRTVDNVNAAGFAGVAMLNRNDRVGGPNAALPRVRFTPTVRRRMIPNGVWSNTNSAVATFALLGFRFSALPVGNRRIIGSLQGSAPFTINLLFDGRIEVEQLRVTGGGTRVRINDAAPLVANTTYDILASFDMSQTTVAAGANCWVNGVQQTVSTFGWGGGPSVQTFWARPQSAFMNAGGDNEINPDGFDFEMGAFWLDPTTRVDLTNSATRARFTSVTAGNLDILTRGDGITGTVPSVFLVGNAAQWSDEFGMNRGSGTGRFMALSTSIGVTTQREPVVAVSGSRWV